MNHPFLSYFLEKLREIAEGLELIMTGPNAGKFKTKGRKDWNKRFGMSRPPIAEILPCPFAPCHKWEKMWIHVMDIQIHIAIGKI